MGKIIDFNSVRKINDSLKENLNINSNQRKNQLYMLIGIPGCGKTTFAKKYLTKTNTIIISTDEIRKELTGTYSFSNKTNEKVFNTAKRRIKSALLNGLNVVFDATNTQKIYRQNFIKVAQDTKSDVVAIIFKTPLSICLERNSKRNIERRVPDNVIINMSTFNTNIDNNEGFSRECKIFCVNRKKEVPSVE
ncbi:ATP-binding protein [Enterococcus cecorum]|uniref:ATP-binding protein n=1 Tax=Enterococcus cecorum TaxID=44008 RepID=UPI00148D09D5|nr:ATP-binding protein [Enterococcus cecorum]MCJ0593267.1 AAA family ATPase [Enterococcus cecorum]